MSQPNVWIIDHRDSFTWNLAELVRVTGMAVPRVVSNLSPELEQAVQAGEKLILSPGPGTVKDECHQATFRLLDRLPPCTPVLGVCLGHQILGIRFGARLEHLSQPLHGVREPIRRTESCPLLEGLPEEFSAGLYHSWRLAATPWPEELVVTARDSGGNIQAIRHRFRPLYGIQFHPESILTPDGKSLLRNFLSLPANAVEGSPASNESMIHSQHQG